MARLPPTHGARAAHPEQPESATLLNRPGHARTALRGRARPGGLTDGPAQVERVTHRRAALRRGRARPGGLTDGPTQVERVTHRRGG
ncbi:hypothetical protein, partial [Streptacidiphilus neutrinimicus]|uniref:hypothetical protein n=1 Tax=Streptacidiphilus neutrinimicus TaxID=105420 RepID=UPI001F23F1B6